MIRRGDVLNFAILGLLSDSPLHGYELRKRVSGILGPFRAISYGSLYPALRTLATAGLIEEAAPSSEPALVSRRSRRVYALTSEGKEHLQEMLASYGPDTWGDEPFAVRMALFSLTPTDVRLRILEGRRSLLEGRLATLQEALSQSSDRIDRYLLGMQQHGIEGVERELRWLNELIEQERS